MHAPGIDGGIWRQHAWRNRLQSVLLLLTMAGFLALLGWLLWGPLGLVVLGVMGLATMLFTPRLQPRTVMRLYGAQPLAPEQIPELWELLARLAERAGLGFVPQLYYLPSRVLNAFAVGRRDEAAIAVTDGLLHQLSRRELLGVLAHEISHIRSQDLWVMALADLLSRATRLLSLLGQLLLLLNLPLLLLGAVTIDWYAIALLIFAPLISALAQLALSRTREYDADLGAARLTGDPDGLASALDKIERLQGGWMERLFMSRRAAEPSTLRSHPATADRINRLMQIKPAISPLDLGGRYPFGHGLIVPVTRRPRRHFNGLWY